MADFRKLFLVLVVMAVAAATAFGQGTFNCQGNTAVNLTLRAGGLTERLGDLQLLCQGGTGPDVSTGFQVFVSGATVTNRLGTASGAGNVISATLEKFASDATTLIASVPGILEPGGFVLFPGVTLPTGTTSYVRIVNLRVNPSQQTTGAQVFENVTTTTPTTVPVMNAVLAVGTVFPSFSFSVNADGKPVTFSTCTAQASDGPAQLSVTFSEQSASAFKNQAEEGTDADTGTRLLATFTNVPANVTLKVAKTANLATGSTPGAVAVIVPDADANGLGGTATPGAGLISTQGSGSTQYAVWEVTADSQSGLDNLVVPVQVTYKQNVPSQTGTGPVPTVAGNLAPFSTVTGSDTSAKNANIPRFQTSPISKPFFTLASCVTNLLFPYVTSAGGWDTGFAISNTSKDENGTFSQTGDCSLNFFGTNPPATNPQVLSAVAPGTVAKLDLATVADPAKPFDGYVIAQCNFQFAHGVSIIISANGNSLFPTMFPALVIPDRGRVPQAFSLGSATNDGEQLAF